jgi:predicted MFS family arabinose efflux permease
MEYLRGTSSGARHGTAALISSSVVARLPEAMLSVELLVHARALTGSFAVAGTVTGAYAVCAAVASPIIGRVVDRRGQTGVLVSSSAISAAVLIVIGLLGRGTAPGVLVALAAVTGLFCPPLSACVRTLLPALVSKASELAALFAFESTAIEVTFVVGPPLALGLGAAWSTGGALIVSGIALLAGTIVFAAHPVSRSWRPDPDAERAAGGALRSAAIRTLVIVEWATGLVFGATELGVTAAATHLSTAAAAAPVLGLWGAGSLIGGVVATRRGGGATSPGAIAGLLGALAVLHGALLFGAGNFVVMSIVITLAGATIAPTGASIYALADKAAPRGTSTEAFSWLYTASLAGAAIGAALAGALVQSAGASAAFALGGVAGMVAVLAVLLGPVSAARPAAPALDGATL